MSFSLEEEIADYIGFKLWKNRDKNKQYDYYGCKEGNEMAEDYFKMTFFITNHCKLLCFKSEDKMSQYKDYYILNLRTLKPTKKSYIQKELSDELKLKISSHF